MYDELYSQDYLERKSDLLRTFVSKDFLLMLQDELIKIYGGSENYLLGDDLYADLYGGTFTALERVCKFYQADEIIHFLDEIAWYEYDDFMDAICYEYARKYKLYTPKRRNINIRKAEKMLMLHAIQELT